jgi:hypothetical protein
MRENLTSGSVRGVDVSSQVENLEGGYKCLLDTKRTRHKSRLMAHRFTSQVRRENVLMSALAGSTSKTAIRR